MNKSRRTKDKGKTRQTIIAIMRGEFSQSDKIPVDIGWLEFRIRQFRMDTDVSVRTAIKNMLKDGLIERENRQYSAYDSVLYRLKVPE